MKHYLYLLTFLGICTFANAQNAQPGKLDSTFGNNGSEVTQFVTSNASGELHSQVLRQPDGKYIVVFTLYPFKERSIQSVTVLARHLSNGDIDSNFGYGGYTQTVDLYSKAGDLYSAISPDAVLQPDGKIVVAGTTRNGDFGLARFTAYGQLDPGFGVNGLTSIDFGSDEVQMVLDLLPDNRIVVGGRSATNFALARLLPDGRPDPSLDNDGKLIYALDGLGDQSAIAVQPDGKILLTGNANIGGNWTPSLARINENGTLDESFGNGGVVPYSGNVIEVLHDGSILLGGGPVRKFTSTGAPYPSFSVDNVQSIIYDLAVQPDGKIVWVSTNGIVGRLNSNGTRDNTLSFLIPNPSGDVVRTATSVLVEPDGKIVVAGFIHNNHSTVWTRYDYVLFRFSPGGQLDPGFNWRSSGNYPFGSSGFSSVTVQPDGKVIAAGYTIANMDLPTIPPLQYRFTLARYNPDGTLDSSFDDDGKVICDYTVSRTDFTTILPQKVALQPDGKIVVAGSGTDTYAANPLILMRLNADGSADASFGQNGIVVFEESGKTSMIGLAPSGSKIIVAKNNSVFRVLTNGDPDPGFSGDGVLTVDFLVKDVVVQPDGKIILGGNRDNAFVMARINEDGSLDPSFGGDGSLVVEESSAASAVSLALDGNKIVAASNSNIYRRLANGAPDPAFGSNGVAGAGFELTDMAVLPNGKVVVGSGQFADFALAAFNSNGYPDSTFGENGRVFTDFSLGTDILNAIAVHNNRVYAVGNYNFLPDTRQSLSLIAAYRLEEAKPRYFLNDLTVSENDRYANVVVALSKPSTSTVVFSYTTRNGTAEHPKDYQKQFGMGYIPAGQTSTFIRIAIRSDKEAENDEYFDVVTQVIFSAPDVQIGNTIARVTIKNADENDKNKKGNIVANDRLPDRFDAQVLVYPNPSSSGFTLRLAGATNVQVPIRILNSQGQLLESKVVPANGTLQFGAAYKPGTYFVEIGQGAGKKVLSALKQ